MSADTTETDLLPIQTDQSETEILPTDFLTGAVQTTQILQGTTIPGPDDKTWKTYWSGKDKDAWALVWDSFVTKGDSLYNYWKSGASVPYTFNSNDCVDAEARKWGLVPMTDAQKVNARSALSALSAVTGLSFVETTGKLTDGLVITMVDLGGSTYGQHFFDDVGGGKTQYTIGLNWREYGPDPKNTKAAVDSLAPGEAKLFGYVSLLHELAHAAGLDDAEASGSDSLINVNPPLARTEYTVMGYTGKTVNTNYTDLDRRALSMIYRKTETSTKPTLAIGGIDTEYEDIDNLDDSFTPNPDPNANANAGLQTNPTGADGTVETHEEESSMSARAGSLGGISLASLIDPSRYSGLLAQG